MWFEDRPSAIVSSGYSVATSTSPSGPFATVVTAVAMADVPGDFDLLVDDDGACYHVQTTTNDPNAMKGFAVTLLNNAYTGPAVPKKSAPFQGPMPAEGPVFFKRGDTYYILGGTTCCACRGGSSIYVFVAPSPLGPWRYLSDVGSRPSHTYNPNSPTNYVTGAQASTVIQVSDGKERYVWARLFFKKNLNLVMSFFCGGFFGGVSPYTCTLAHHRPPTAGRRSQFVSCSQGCTAALSDFCADDWANFSDDIMPCIEGNNTYGWEISGTLATM